MKENLGKDIIFMLTKDEILACAGEVEISEERMTDDVVELVKRRLNLEFRHWPEIVSSHLKETTVTATQNSYPELLIDEVSGIEVPDTRHKIWTEGYKAGRKDEQVIKCVIKTQNGMVLVFDDRGEQIPEYQGQYEQVRLCILRDAPVNAVFSHVFNYESELRASPRKEW